MNVYKVFYDSCDSWTTNTLQLKTIAKKKEDALKYIVLNNNGKEISEDNLSPYWSIEEFELYEAPE